MDASVPLPRLIFLNLEKPVFISNAYAQAAGGDTASSLMGLLPLLLMFVVLYFVMIRPQMKRQKEHKTMIEALAKGDEVSTASGLLGKVTKLGETVISVEIAPGVEVQMHRVSVAQVLPKGSVK
jgi:preprotein translocase subunit YajC